MLANLLRQYVKQYRRQNFPALELLKGNAENPKGFFESRLLVETNEYLLELVNARWDRPYLARPCWSEPQLLNNLTSLRERFSFYRKEPWIDKDPRLCLLWTPYRHILLCEPVGVAIVRNPLLVAGSLALRNGFSGEKSALIWWLYHHHLLAAAPSQQLLIVDDAAVLEGDATTVNALASFLEHHQEINASQDKLSELVSQTCEPDQRRAQPLRPEPNGLLEQAHQVWLEWQASGWKPEIWRTAFDRLPSQLLERYEQEFGQLCGSDNPPLSTQFARHYSMLQELQLQCHNNEAGLKKTAADMQSLLTNCLQEQMEQIWGVNQELSNSKKKELELQKQLNEIRLSRSWWITRPLRKLSRMFRSLSAMAAPHLGMNHTR